MNLIQAKLSEQLQRELEGRERGDSLSRRGYSPQEMVRTEEETAFYPSELNFTKDKLIENIKSKLKKAQTTQSTPQKEYLLPKVNLGKLD